MPIVDLAAITWLSRINPINHTIFGTRFRDILAAKAEGDVVFGLDGNDSLSSAYNQTALIGGKANDTLKTEVVVPVTGMRALQGLAIQYGGDGNDRLDAKVTFQGGEASDVGREFKEEILLSGGDGNDVIKAVANVVAPIFGDLTATTYVLGGTGHDTIDVLADGRGAISDNVVKNYVDGGSGKDRITARADTEFIAGVATAINVLKGGSGDDVLDAWARGQAQGTGLVKNYLLGGEGNDVLRAYGLTNSNSRAPVGVNELYGGGGNDTLEVTHEDGGNTRTDITSKLYGGTGNDTLKVVADVHSPSQTVKALNILDGSDGKDTLIARLDVDIGGGPGPFDIANVLTGGDGNDSLDATLSLDIDFPEPTAVLIAENRLEGGGGNDTLVARVATGSLGSSSLKGGSGDDKLTVVGGSGNLLEGGTGRDTLTSGVGDDHMNGGADADRFVFAPLNGHDEVVFEKGTDKIDLRAYAAGGIHALGDLDINVSGGNSTIVFDLDNDILVLDVDNLQASDFLFA